MPIIKSNDSSERRLNVLLVEDHLDTLNAMSRLLNQMGHRVRTACSVASAIAMARDRLPDLLISDLGLPDGSGLQIMRELLSQGVKGIALSGFGMEDDLRRSDEAGFAKHLTKPIDITTLERALKEVRI